MAIYLDTSALLATHLEGPARDVVLAAMREHEEWCTSAITMAESLALIDRLTDEPVLRSDLEDAVRLLWDRLFVVPVDSACLDRTSDLMREQPLLLSDAIHLASADRLPRPVVFVTSCVPQITGALALGFEVISA